MIRATLFTLAAIFAVSTNALAADEVKEAATTPVGHGVSTIGNIFEADLGEETFAKLLELTKGKVLNLKEVTAVDGKLKTNTARLITLQPKDLLGQKTLEVKIRTFNGLPPEPKKVAELLELAKKTEPFVSEEDYKKQTSSDASAGKVYETYSATASDVSSVDLGKN